MRRVAITGLGVTSAIGTGTAAFFESLLAARSGIRLFDITFPTGDESVLGAPVELDAEAHFSRARLLTMDRVSQMALVAVREAMAQAGLSSPEAWPSAMAPERFGVCMGTGNGGAGSTDLAYTALLVQKAARLRPMTVVLGMNNAIAAHAAMEFGLKGPSSTISNACASSANAIGEAFRQIRHGYADVMLAGGAEAPLHRGSVKAWQAMQTLAKVHPSGAAHSCRPFSADRSGLVLGEGAAMLVLESWDSAQARGATILAELVGYASTTDAHHLTQPDATGQQRAMTLALADARLNEADIGYLNAHGTATEVGDVVETDAIKLAFGAAATALPVSSSKAVLGHTMGAAGAMEFIASLLALQHRQLPPTACLELADARCDLDYVALTARDCPTLRTVMSNSFAFGGSNAVLIAQAV